MNLLRSETVGIFVRRNLVLLASVLGAALAPAVAAPFTIQVNYLGGLSTSQQSVFTTAASTWMGLLPQYQPGINIAALSIDAKGEYIDGPGGILGSAGPTHYTVQAGYSVATKGSMSFDSDDLSQMESNGTLLNVILHEMAHVMGFGTMWQLNSVYVAGSGQFTGANAVAAYRAEFVDTDPLAGLFVPVELGGGAGTANGHWDEVDGGGGDTTRTSSNGNMRYELMTGWLNPGSYISQTTIASFHDIGYSSVPEPGSIVLISGGLLVLGIWRRRVRA